MEGHSRSVGDLDPSAADCEARPIRKAQRKRHSADSKLKVKPGEGAAIISNHGGHPGASRGVEAGDRGNPEAKSGVFTNAQTGLYRTP